MYFFDSENISFDANLVIYIYIYSTNIPPILIINRIYGTQNLLHFVDRASCNDSW